MFNLADHRSSAVTYLPYNDAIFLDFAKAFDNIAHRRLARKLAVRGISGKVLQLIEAWLADRKQRVRINGTMSIWLLAPILKYLVKFRVQLSSNSSSQIWIHCCSGQKISRCYSILRSAKLCTQWRTQRGLGGFKPPHWIFKKILYCVFAKYTPLSLLLCSLNPKFYTGKR